MQHFTSSEASRPLIADSAELHSWLLKAAGQYLLIEGVHGSELEYRKSRDSKLSLPELKEVVAERHRKMQKREEARKNKEQKQKQAKQQKENVRAVASQAAQDQKHMGKATESALPRTSLPSKKQL